MPSFKVNWSITVSGTHTVEDAEESSILDILEDEWRELVSEASGHDIISIDSIEVINA